jgi:hypothetical protein
MTTSDDGPSARAMDTVMTPIDTAVEAGFEDALPRSAAGASGSGRAAASAAAAADAAALLGPDGKPLPPKPKFAALSAHDQNGRRVEFRRVS